MTGAIILSAGTGQRMGTVQCPKQYLSVCGKPVLVHTIEQFQQHDQVDAIWVVAASVWEETIIKWKNQYGLDKLQTIAPPGRSRQESILNGLRAAKVQMEHENDGIIIQDAVRPLTSQELITKLINGLMEAPCVMPALPVTDTVYLSEDGTCISGLLERSQVFAGQAPEAFHFSSYLEICERVDRDELNQVHGSCELPCRFGMKVNIIPGETENIKITYPSDLELFQTIWNRRKKEKEG